MAVFWLLLYVFVNLTSILYLGSLAVSSISGIPFFYCMLGLALFSIFITLGGMKVIGYTDIIQVVVLVLGGLVVTYLALDMVSDRFNGCLLYTSSPYPLHWSRMYPLAAPDLQVLLPIRYY